MQKFFPFVLSQLFLIFSVNAEAFQPDVSFKPEVAKSAFTQTYPVVIFDQGHLNLAATDGRYAPLMHLLESDGLKLRVSTEKITPAVLTDAQILYISGAQGSNYRNPKEAALSAFTKDECQVIRAWVEEGGALLLMSDHTSIGDSIHPLAEIFGVKVSAGETNDPVNFLPALGDTSHLLFSDENHLIAQHPVVYGRDAQERVHRVAVFSGQSIQGPKGSKIILSLSKTAENHFQDGSKRYTGNEYAEAVSFHYGAGRVVMFGDATVFTSKIQTEKHEKEGMNRPDIDNVKLATNTFRWLAGKLGD